MDDYSKTIADKCKFSVGEKFSTFAELSKKIYAYQMDNCVRLYKRDAKLIYTMTKKIKDLELKANPKLKYFMVVYACIYGGQLHMNQKYKNRNQMCNMRIHFRMTVDGNFLEVKKLWDEHNHPLQTDGLDLENSNPHEDLLFDLDNMNDELRRNYDYLYKEDGSHVTDECGNIVLYNQHDGTYILTKNQVDISENNKKKVSWDSVSTLYFLEQLLKMVESAEDSKIEDEMWIDLSEIMKQKNFIYQPTDIKKRWGALKNIYKYDIWTHGTARGQYAKLIKKILPEFPEKKGRKGMKRLANGNIKVKEEMEEEEDGEDDGDYKPNEDAEFFLNENDGILQIRDGEFENVCYEEDVEDEEYADDSSSVYLDQASKKFIPSSEEIAKHKKKSNPKEINLVPTISSSSFNDINPIINHIDECFGSLKSMIKEQHTQSISINNALLNAINGLQETFKK